MSEPLVRYWDENFRELLPPYEIGSDFIVMPRECFCGQVHNELRERPTAGWTITIGEPDETR